MTVLSDLAVNLHKDVRAANPFMLLNDRQNAAQHYRRFAKAESSAPQAHGRLRTYYLFEGEMERGLSECEQPLRLDPSIPDGDLCMGLDFAEQGHREQARQEFPIVIATAPGMVAEQARRQLDRLD